ncbi:hypothetical protein C8P67_104422 [Flavobacterium aquicola]|uniref:Uncharacterized protein n=2 Tax=Flavobacterium aquicola TaxID=1682742 RepID=A0A3E0ENX4_9FLAO|nr:hypothetical protein C8P67_104422 [Flavobacterium aquicola]
MKRFLGILCCVIAFSSCDDGDLIVETINFDQVTTSSCSANNLLFKMKESEILILNIPKNSFDENATPPDNPKELVINTTNQVVYNFYDGKVATNNVCDLIPPSSPNVETQWKASDGIIEITTVAVKTTVDENNNSTKITGYKNTIVFKNITFTKENGTEQFYKTFSFGDYLQSITPLKLDFKQVLSACPETDDVTRYVYKTSDSDESISLNIDKKLLKNEDTPEGKPRIGNIGIDINKLVYRFYGGFVDNTYFCKDEDPAEPEIKEEWLGAGGTVEVTTVTVGNDFKHTIVLKNVNLEKGNNSFSLGKIYQLGSLTVVP